MGPTHVQNILTENTASMVDRLFREYLIPHALRFFCSTIESGDTFSHAKEIAGLILSKSWERVRRSDLTQNYRPAKNAEPYEIEKWMECLIALGWLEPEANKNSSRIKAWLLNPAVHKLFSERAIEERLHRSETRANVLANIKGITEN
jgi:hypothetical protein